MNVTTTPAPKSSVRLEVELPPERLSRAIDEAVRRLSRRHRVPGFRPGKVPRPVLERVLGPGVVLDEAVDRLSEDAFREALIERSIVPLRTSEFEIVQAEEGKPFIFRARVEVPPEVQLGDYRNFPFRPSIPPVDDAAIDRVVEELRDQHAVFAPVEDRPARQGDFARLSYRITRGEEEEVVAESERLTLEIGGDDPLPGLSERIVGLRRGESGELETTLPDDYPDSSLAGASVRIRFEVTDLRERILPPLDDEFAQMIGDYPTLADLRAEIRRRLERNALDRARHDFADRIIEYAVANATVELPDALVDQEVELLHDELRGSLARVGLTEDAYLSAVGKTEAELHAEYRPAAEKRAKALLVLSKIAEVEGIDVPEAEVEAELARLRARLGSQSRTARTLDSDRGRRFVRSSLRRSRVVERLVDDWLAAHPEHPPLPHLEDAEERAERGSDAATEPAPRGPATATGPIRDTEPVTEGTAPAVAPGDDRD
ncbi:MAG TPA: trigger factor [Candidatus Limnocylindrales bacterium]|nr:trigger factor [Candidatus Limnocylindrales bacterium]